MDENQWTTILDELKILSYLDVHYNLVNLVAANTADIARLVQYAGNPPILDTLFTLQEI